MQAEYGDGNCDQGYASIVRPVSGQRLSATKPGLCAGRRPVNGGTRHGWIGIYGRGAHEYLEEPSGIDISIICFDQPFGPAKPNKWPAKRNERSIASLDREMSFEIG